MNAICRSSQLEYLRTATDLPREDISALIVADEGDDADGGLGTRCVIVNEKLDAGTARLFCYVLVGLCESRVCVTIILTEPCIVAPGDNTDESASMGQAAVGRGGSQDAVQLEGVGEDSGAELEERERVRAAGQETLQGMMEERHRLLQQRQHQLQSRIRHTVQSFKRQKTIAMEPEERIGYLDTAIEELRHDLEAEEECARLLKSGSKRKASVDMAQGMDD